MKAKKILIAGGSGLIGSRLKTHLVSLGHEVDILSRKESNDYIHWDLAKGYIDASKIQETQILINLCGEGIAEKNWTSSRKKALLDSRVETAKLLFKYVDKMPFLEQYISASGITCYGYKEKPEGYTEDDPFGEDYISQLVKKWESSADLFASKVPVAKVRTGIVLSSNGGAIEKMIKPVRYGLGAALGSGKQIIPWIHIDDLSRIFSHLIEHGSQGTFNACANNDTNKNFMNTLAKVLGKRNWLPAVPGFLLKMMLGQMATLILKGVHVSNEKIQRTNFKFEYVELNEALKSLNLK